MKSPEFERGGDRFHVLRLLGNGQISAGKAAELLSALQRGERPEIPPFEADDPMPRASNAENPMTSGLVTEYTCAKCGERVFPQNPGGASTSWHEQSCRGHRLAITADVTCAVCKDLIFKAGEFSRYSVRVVEWSGSRTEIEVMHSHCIGRSPL